MNDPAFRRVGKGFGSFPDNKYRLRLGQGAVFQQLADGMTFHIFHHNIGKTGHGFCFHIHDRDNIRVLDPGGELCFTDEPFPVFRIICPNIRVEQFQRTHGFQLGMADQINSAHATGAEAAFHAIFIDHLPRFKKKIHACSFVFQNQGY